MLMIVEKLLRGVVLPSLVLFCAGNLVFKAAGQEPNGAQEQQEQTRGQDQTESGEASAETARKTIDQQVAILRELSAASGDPCLAAKVVAVSDERTVELIAKKWVEQRHVPTGVECLRIIGLPSHRHVLFSFRCRPGTLCLVDPSFLVTVDMMSRRVVGIADPYIPQHAASSDCMTCGGGAEPAVGCSADVSVSLSDGGLRIEGEVDCLCECDIDITLNGVGDKAEVSCDCRVGSFKVRATRVDGSCIELETKVLGGWQSLGTYCL